MNILKISKLHFISGDLFSGANFVFIYPSCWFNLMFIWFLHLKLG